MTILNEETIFEAFLGRETELILNWLKKSPDNCNVKDPLRGTPFLMACYFGEEKILDYLFTQNVDIHQKDKNGKNAIFTAVLANRYHIVEKLYKKGININEKEKRFDSLPLIYAATSNYIESIEILIRLGADVNYKNRREKDMLSYVESGVCKLKTAYLMKYFHLFTEENQKRIKKIRLKRLFEGEKINL